jgi:hypothetical protein
MGDVTVAERRSNEAYFAGVVVADEEERSLVEAAKELRLVLPRHLRE